MNRTIVALTCASLFFGLVPVFGIDKEPFDKDWVKPVVQYISPDKWIVGKGKSVNFSLLLAAHPKQPVVFRYRVRVDDELREQVSEMRLQEIGSFELQFDKPGLHSIAVQSSDGVMRTTFVEVVDKVRLLLVDGTPKDARGRLKGADSLKKFFSVGFDIVEKSPEDLTEKDLAPYAAVYFVNVRDFKANDKKFVDALHDYVNDGGGVAFFVGDQVDPTFYNEKLFAKGDGLLPARLADKPTKELDEEARTKLIAEMNSAPSLKVVFPNRFDPIVKDFDGSTSEMFKFMLLERHWPATVKESKDVNTVVSLPAAKAKLTGAQKKAITAMLEKITTISKEKGCERYRPLLEWHAKRIEGRLEDDNHQVATAFDDFLLDRGKDEAPKAEKLTYFWREQADLQYDAEEIVRGLRVGEPLMLTKRVGLGRTFLSLTTVGREWNDWQGGSMASFTFPVLMSNLNKTLIGDSVPLKEYVIKRTGDRLWTQLIDKDTDKRNLAWMTFQRSAAGAVAFLGDKLDADKAKKNPIDPAHLSKAIQLLEEIGSEEAEKVLKPIAENSLGEEWAVHAKRALQTIATIRAVDEKKGK